MFKEYVNNNILTGRILIGAFIMMAFSILVVRLCAFKNADNIMNTISLIWLFVTALGVINILRIIFNIDHTTVIA